VQQSYYKQDSFCVAVDCIIFGFDESKLKLLIIKRDFEPEKNKWSLMGGFLQKKESLDEAAQRILKKLTGLSDVFLEQLYTYGEVGRDALERVISVAYYALIKADDLTSEIAEKHNAKWFDIEEVPDLIFDHKIMVEKALRRLQRKSKSQPIGIELLPEKFTIPQIQTLYEAINQKEFDKRNFRKKILSMGAFQKLDEKEKESSKKGAFLYRFDKEKYEELIKNGYHFEL
jgi:ADP-ribose pyrophosphatase YjhB (NUDIX family)